MSAAKNSVHPLVLPVYTLADLRNSLDGIIGQALYGCGDGGCIIKRPVGQHTNGGCRCHPRDIARTLRHIAEAVESRGDWQNMTLTNRTKANND